MWSLGITLIEMMDRVPPHYLLKDETELFTYKTGPQLVDFFNSYFGLVMFTVKGSQQDGFM